MPVPRVVVTFTIPAGQFLSQGVDCTEGYFARLQMPAQWTSANLSFQISDDGITYYDLVDKMGQEALIPVVAGTATMIRMEPWSSAIGWWKLRSGSVRGPVVQLCRGGSCRQFASRWRRPVSVAGQRASRCGCCG